MVNGGSLDLRLTSNVLVIMIMFVIARRRYGGGKEAS
jgi:hypothetical protein